MESDNADDQETSQESSQDEPTAVDTFMSEFHESRKK